MFIYKCVLTICSKFLSFIINHQRNFDVLLTVHLNIILATDQPNAQILVL